MKYKPLNGVVYTRVCDQNILVATRKVWGKCPYTKRLSALRGAFWQGITMGMSEDEIVKEINLKTNIKEPAIRKQYKNFIDTMLSDGYLTAEENDA